MRYAIVSDVHANESALRQVLADAAAHGAERVVCLGDVVGYGPLPAETVALVRKSVGTTLCGNHDDAVSGRQGAESFIALAGDAVKRHRDVLKSADLAWLRRLPYVCELEGAVAAHGDFVDPAGFNYIDDEASAARNFAATEAPLMFVGHTHVPGFFLTGRSGSVYRMAPQDFMLEAGKRYIVNPGSVGYPREHNGTCRSSYVLYDSTARTVLFRFLPFAVASMIQRGTGTRRSTAGVWGAVALAVAAAAVAAVFPAARRSAPAEPPAARTAAGEAGVDLSIARKTLTLRPGDRFVRANLKVDRKGDPVALRIEFKSATGDLVGEQMETVKGSSAKRFKIPDGALSAHFTLLRQQATSHATVLSFSPSAL
ncbi:MAG: metallophosphoesterase family protein [Kiritimatiellia bacterium]